VTRTGFLAIVASALFRLDAQPAPQAPGGQGPPVPGDLAPILERAAQYVLDYEQRFHDVVADEAYEQLGPPDARKSVNGIPLRCGQAFCHRTTRADIVFVRLGGDIPWGTFRDVYEVDGQKVRDRDARIERLFRDTPEGALERARTLLDESARHNIGPAIRTLNFPTLTLTFLLAQNQPRFAWRRGGRRRFAGIEGVEVRFEERTRPTLIQDGAHGDPLAARGRLWIDPARGIVMGSESCFRWEPERAEACLVTEYRPEPALAMWVPKEMRETYSDLPNGALAVFGARSEATARYSAFRRFRVTVQDEKVTLPEPKEQAEPDGP
jgi:hypothetical protein